jgi:hypothetical protein
MAVGGVVEAAAAAHLVQVQGLAGAVAEVVTVLEVAALVQGLEVAAAVGAAAALVQGLGVLVG